MNAGSLFVSKKKVLVTKIEINLPWHKKLVNQREKVNKLTQVPLVLLRSSACEKKYSHHKALTMRLFLI